MLFLLKQDIRHNAGRDQASTCADQWEIHQGDILIVGADRLKHT